MAKQSLLVLPPDALRHLVTAIVSSTFFGSVLVALILTLFSFSTPETRRHTVFILNIIACCSGICEAAVSNTLLIEQIIYSTKQAPKSLHVAANCLDLFSGIFVDSILLFRVLAFYPFSVTPTPKFVAIFTLPVLAKCARFGVAMVYVHEFTHASSPNIETAVQSIWPRNPFIFTGTTLQVIDNSYASGILLYKINQFRRERNEFFKISSGNLVSTLHSLVIIVLGNFVVPVAINIISIAMLAANVSFSKVSIVFLCDNYISIIGIVFATMWTRRRYWNRHDQTPDDFQLETYRHTAPFTSGHTRTVLSTIHFGNENVESVHDGAITSMQEKGKEQGNINSDLDSSHPSLTKT